MDNIQRFTKRLTLNHKGDICFTGTLSTSNHTDTISAKRAKQLSSNTWSMLHVLTNNSHGSQSLLELHLIHSPHLYLLGKLRIQHLTSTIGIFVTHTNRSTVLRTCLTDHKHTYTISRQCCEDSLVYTNHTHH